MSIESLKFTRGEYWLLESAVELMIPFSDLVSPHIEALFNKPHHGYTPAQLSEALVSLARRKLITFKPATVVVPNSTSVRAALVWGERPARDHRPCYGLTAAGGAAWQRFALPDWSKYCEMNSGTDDDDECWLHEMTCTTKEVLDNRLDRLFLQRHHLLDMRYSVVRPWQVSYWKRLPVGHRLEFRETFTEAEARRHTGRLLPNNWYWPK